MDAAPWNKDDSHANFYSSNYKPTKKVAGGNGMMDILFQRSPSGAQAGKSEEFAGKGAGAFSPAHSSAAPYATREALVDDVENLNRIKANMLGDKGNKFATGADKVGSAQASGTANFNDAHAAARNARDRNRGSGLIFASPPDHE